MEKEEIKIDEKKQDNILEKEISEKNRKSSENKTLKNVFIVISAFGLVFILVVLFINSIRHFEYNGMTGDVVKEGNLIFYQTSIPVFFKGEEVPYNFYLRNDPRKLDEIPFDGEIVFLKQVVLNSSAELNCDGDGIIAIKNLATLYEVLGAKVIKDENASCDPMGRYIFLDIKPSNKTSVEQFGPACYNLNVNNCEILKSTERFMVETFVKLKEDRIVK